MTTSSLNIVQDVVLYVTVLLGVLLYTFVLARLVQEGNGSAVSGRHRTYLTLALVGVITMIFGVGCAHQIWPQENKFWFPALGVLVIGVGWIIYRLRKLSPKRT